MTQEAQAAAATIIAIIISRVLSHIEHKKGKKEINEIKIIINGRMDEMLKAEREKGREEGRKEGK